MNTDGFDTLAPLFAIFALFFIGSCVICACHRRCCSDNKNKIIDGEYVKYGSYFDKAYNETIDENTSGTKLRSSLGFTHRLVRVGTRLHEPKRTKCCMDP